MGPVGRLLLVSAGGICLLKLVVLALRREPIPRSGLIAFLFAWPGVVPSRFRVRSRAGAIDPIAFLSAWARMAVGLAGIVLLGIFAPSLSDGFAGLCGTFVLLLTLHLGFCDLLPWCLRWAGFPVPLLFDRPWMAASLGEFWSRRWNLAFVEMNQHLFLRPVYRIAGRRGSRFLLFGLSGVLHELALSFPVGAGWGFPLGYFLLQGVLVEAEHQFHIRSRAWTWFWILAPSPCLFHAPFRRVLILPFIGWLHRLIALHTSGWYLSSALYAAAVGNLLVLIASFQVPARLHWKEDLAKLTCFNRRIFWVYGFYILLSIVSFAVLTFRLHDAFLAGGVAARWLAGFIAVFWSMRVIIDFGWYRPLDWPPGNALVAGHALATTLFCALATVYWCAALHHASVICAP